jgi:hypothetical protein
MEVFSLEEVRALDENLDAKVRELALQQLLSTQRLRRGESSGNLPEGPEFLELFEGILEGLEVVGPRELRIRIPKHPDHVESPKLGTLKEDSQLIYKLALCIPKGPARGGQTQLTKLITPRGIANKHGTSN